MPDSTRIFPAHWLLCSAAVERAIRGQWAASHATDSLTQLRLRRDLVERVELSRLHERAQQLARSECGTVRVVVERMGEAEVTQIKALDDVDADLRLHVWREDPIEVMETLAAPEDALLDKWETMQRMPDDIVFVGPLRNDAAWRAEYLAAVSRWEREARAVHLDAFTERYGPDRTWERVKAQLLGDFVETGTAIEAKAVRVRREEEPEGAFARTDADEPSAPPVRVWPTRDGKVEVTLLLPDDEGSQADILIEVRLQSVADARAIRRIELRIGALLPIELSGPDGAGIEWHDTGRGTVVSHHFCDCPRGLRDAVNAEDTMMDVVFHVA